MKGSYMNKTYKLLFLLAAILAACTNELLPETIDEAAPESYTLAVNATKGNDDTIKALSLDDKTLNATWAAGDQVQVYHVSNPGTMTEMESTTPNATLTAQGNGAKTTLSSSFTGSYTPAVGDVLRLRFLPNPDYTTQEGTLDYIATHCDYAVATITVASVDALTGNVTAAAPASFENQQTVVEFSLKQPDGTTSLAATSLKVKVGSTTYNVMPTAAASDFYVAVRGASNKAVSLSAYTDYGKFGYEKAGITFETGKYYAIGVKMESRAMDKSLTEVTASEIGWRIGSDGVAYEPTDNLPSGVSPVAMIGYISEKGHGLAIELNNSPNKVTWAEALSIATSGKTSIKNCTWRLPSFDDWFNILVGCAVEDDQTAFPIEGSTALQPVHGFHRKYYATGFSLAVAEEMSGSHFWTSTELLTTTANEVWLGFYNNEDYAWFAEKEKTNSNNYVLAVLAF